MFNSLKLKGVIASHGDKQTHLAKAMNITASRLTNALKGRTELRRPEIETIVRRYNLSGDDVINIFFYK